MSIDFFVSFMWLGSGIVNAQKDNMGIFQWFRNKKDHLFLHVKILSIQRIHFMLWTITKNQNSCVPVYNSFVGPGSYTCQNGCMAFCGKTIVLLFADFDFFDIHIISFMLSTLANKALLMFLCWWHWNWKWSFQTMGILLL